MTWIHITPLWNYHQPALCLIDNWGPCLHVICTTSNSYHQPEQLWLIVLYHMLLVLLGLVSEVTSSDEVLCLVSWCQQGYPEEKALLITNLVKANICWADLLVMFSIPCIEYGCDLRHWCFSVIINNFNQILLVTIIKEPLSATVLSKVRCDAFC